MHAQSQSKNFSGGIVFYIAEPTKFGFIEIYTVVMETRVSGSTYKLVWSHAVYRGREVNRAEDRVRQDWFDDFVQGAVKRGARIYGGPITRPIIKEVQ